MNPSQTIHAVRADLDRMGLRNLADRLDAAEVKVKVLERFADDEAAEAFDAEQARAANGLPVGRV